MLKRPYNLKISNTLFDLTIYELGITNYDVDSFYDIFKDLIDIVPINNDVSKISITAFKSALRAALVQLPIYCTKKAHELHSSICDRTGSYDILIDRFAIDMNKPKSNKEHYSQDDYIEISVRFNDHGYSPVHLALHIDNIAKLDAEWLSKLDRHRAEHQKWIQHEASINSDVSVFIDHYATIDYGYAIFKFAESSIYSSFNPIIDSIDARTVGDITINHQHGSGTFTDISKMYPSKRCLIVRHEDGACSRQRHGIRYTPTDSTVRIWRYLRDCIDALSTAHRYNALHIESYAVGQSPMKINSYQNNDSWHVD